MGPVEVVTTDEFKAWYQGIDDADAQAVTDAVDFLAEVGVALRFPRQSHAKGSKHGLRELRVQSGGKPLRVFYGYDPLRAAVLLIGGDKTGDKKFYERMVPLSDAIFEKYLAEQKQGLHE